MNAHISMMILAKIPAGMTGREAFDAVLGEGEFIKLAGDLYDSIRAARGL